jgi:transglutaminase-like putative cysteine protease
MRPTTRRMLLVLLAVLLWNLTARAPAADPGALLNPGFESAAAPAPPDGWTAPKIPGYVIATAVDEPLEGAQCATIICEDAAAGPFGNLVQRIDATPYQGKRLRFQAAVRTADDGAGKARLWLRVDRAAAGGAPAMGAFDNMGNRPITSPQWNHYEIVADVAADAERISAGMMFTGPGQAWIDDASLEIVGDDVAVTARSPQGAARGGAAQADVKPGLFEILGAMVIAPAAKTEEDTSGGDPNTVMREQDVLIPLPLVYRDQTPLTFALNITPPASVAAVDVVRDGPRNTVLRVKLADGRRGAVNITFKSVLLIGPSDFTTVPATASFPSAWPADAIPWLAATWCADSNHEQIQAIATDIRAQTQDVLATIQFVQQATANVFRLARGRGDSLTAVEALTNQGSCTSCANLVAAVLRACGVPARIVAGYPSWSGPLQTHYIVEAYVPDYGWYPIESTMGRCPWPNFQQVQVAIIPPPYESRAKAGSRAGVAPGVPYLSLTELPRNDGSCIAVGTIENARGCDHHCRALQSLEGTGEEWTRAATTASAKWEAWLDGTHELDASGQLEFGDPSRMATPKSVAELSEVLE